jgi:S1-C subfamily serine protease
VESVESGTSAAAAGLEAYDIITAVGERTISNYSDLKQVLRQYSAGDTAELTVYRGGEEIKLNITFDEAKPSNMYDNFVSAEEEAS